MQTIPVAHDAPSTEPPAEPSFDECYAARFRPIAGQLAVYLGSIEEAQEVTQEAFVRAWMRWKRVMLDIDGPREKLEAILAGPEITSVEFQGRTAGLWSWIFTVRCDDDFPAVKLRLDAVPVTGYSWSESPIPPPWSQPSSSSR